MKLPGKLDEPTERHSLQRNWMAPPERVEIDLVPVIGGDHCQTREAALGRFGLQDDRHPLAPTEIQHVLHHVMRAPDLEISFAPPGFGPSGCACARASHACVFATASKTYPTHPAADCRSKLIDPASDCFTASRSNTRLALTMGSNSQLNTVRLSSRILAVRSMSGWSGTTLPSVSTLVRASATVAL